MSGLIWPGPPASFLDAALQRVFHLLTSEEMLVELEKALSRPHLEPRLRIRGRTVAEVMSKQRVLSTIVTPADLATPVELRDLNDLPVLRCAVGGQAQAIVTGDKDLLTLKEFQSVVIMTSRIFLATLGL
ncbi:MAG: putative toxin-antitoxin system toxin component, PIN family [Candidatus Omnitrophica bacterium]|nr:putative toxin-antitoxin system toxin component, PIN family [Candidatus Omnitrophota bacterium]